MATNSTTHASIIAPALVGDLVVRPLINQSIAGQALTEINIGVASINFPVVTADPSAGWVAEGAEISVTDSTVTQVTVTPRKLAGLSIPSRILEHPVLERVADLIPVALLAGLVAVQVVSTGPDLVLDARVAGLGAAAIDDGLLLGAATVRAWTWSRSSRGCRRPSCTCTTRARSSGTC